MRKRVRARLDILCACASSDLYKNKFVNFSFVFANFYSEIFFRFFFVENVFPCFILQETWRSIVGSGLKRLEGTVKSINQKLNIPKSANTN